MNATLQPATTLDAAPGHRRPISDRPPARAESQRPQPGVQYGSPSVPPHRPLPRTEAIQFGPPASSGYPPPAAQTPPLHYGYPAPGPASHPHLQHASAPYPAQGQYPHPSHAPYAPMAQPQPGTYGTHGGYAMAPPGYAQPQQHEFHAAHAAHEVVGSSVAPRQRGMGLLLVLAALFAGVMVTAVVLKVLEREANSEQRGLPQ